MITKALFITFCLLFTTLSCTKPKNLCQEYNLLVGNWENQIGDDKAQMTIFESGKVELKSSIQRRKVFKTYSCFTGTYKADTTWQTIALKGKKDHLFFLYNSSLDSIKIFVGDKISGFTFINFEYDHYLLRIK